MYTLGELLVQLVVDLVRLVDIFLFDIALQDPLALVSWLMGALLVTFSVLVIAYFAVGALGINLPRFGRGPTPRE